MDGALAIAGLALGAALLVSSGRPRRRRPRGATARRTVEGYVAGVPALLEVEPVDGAELLRVDAAAAFRRMRDAAAKAGIVLGVTSGWRSMAEQAELYRRYQAGTGNKAARPGYSDHQAGLSVDLRDVGGYGSATYRWLAENARRFGFVNDVAGEYWHWTFEGA